MGSLNGSVKLLETRMAKLVFSEDFSALLWPLTGHQPGVVLRHHDPVGVHAEGPHPVVERLGVIDQLGFIDDVGDLLHDHGRHFHPHADVDGVLVIISSPSWAAWPANHSEPSRPGAAIRYLLWKISPRLVSTPT